ncbi:MAG: hypothetical protein RI902_1, partial [Pseudomonadota bacterium]|jgi:hypothetical protein
MGLFDEFGAGLVDGEVAHGNCLLNFGRL